jgi:hypothetical protein
MWGPGIHTKGSKGSLKNDLTFWRPMHPVWLRCENSKYPYIPAFLRLTGRAPQRPKMRTYFFVNLEGLRRSEIGEPALQENQCSGGLNGPDA